MMQRSQDSNDKNLYILFDVVAKNGSLRRLTRQGLNFTTIANLTDIAIKDRLLVINGRQELQLTALGVKYLADRRSKYVSTNKEEWIDVDKKHKIAKLDKNAIFVPSQDELSFKLE